jgi:hypothetical protein
VCKRECACVRELHVRMHLCEREYICEHSCVCVCTYVSLQISLLPEYHCTELKQNRLLSFAEEETEA